MKKQYKIAIVVVVILLLAGAVAVWQMGSMEPWQMKAEKPDHTVSGTVSALTPMPEGSDYTMLAAENETYQLLAREDGVKMLETEAAKEQDTIRQMEYYNLIACIKRAQQS